MRKIARVAWKSPSNIAFIKYWGKTGNQLPRNPSLSMTLEKCFTETQIDVFEKKRTGGRIEFKFEFDGKSNQQFSSRIANYLNNIADQLPVLTRYELHIHSSNSFPHSAGIASSASSLSALALCLVTIQQRLGRTNIDDFYSFASGIARLGSGSASRSIYSQFAVWGKSKALKSSSDDFAVALNTSIDPLFKCLRDTILVVDTSEKKISSSEGHATMINHPYAEQRYKSATDNFGNLLMAMSKGEWSTFANILESEAMGIHSMMLTANPWYTLLHPNTLVIIQKITQFRTDTGARISFTLDAGPNVHVIYPAESDNRIQDFILKELLPFCENEVFIKDNIGLGPEMLIDEFK